MLAALSVVRFLTSFPFIEGSSGVGAGAGSVGSADINGAGAGGEGRGGAHTGCAFSLASRCNFHDFHVLICVPCAVAQLLAVERTLVTIFNASFTSS